MLGVEPKQETLPDNCECDPNTFSWCRLAQQYFGPLAKRKCRTDLRYRAKFWKVPQVPVNSTVDLSKINQPSFLERALHFTKSLAAHVANGMRKCDDVELQARLGICQTCPQFTGSGCRVCGCNCTGTREFLNKLAWASESCPNGLWLRIEPTDTAGDPSPLP